MGCDLSTNNYQNAPSKPDYTKFAMIPDQFTTLSHVQDGLEKAGLESSNIIFAIDYTGSNEKAGKISFNNTSLHSMEKHRPNPYQQIIRFSAETLERFDDDHLFPVYGFGDTRTTNKKVFNLKVDGTSCNGIKEIFDVYDIVTPKIQLSGPTSFTPIIKHAIEIVKHTGNYHILVIMTDGCVVDVDDTIQTIVEASKYPLSIIGVGVGDGPFDIMEEFDDKLPQREFDNFQFVNFNKVRERAISKNICVEIQFAIDALQEIPEQYKYLKHQKKLTLPGTSQLNKRWEYIHPTVDTMLGPTIPLISQNSNQTDENLCPICLTNKADGVLVPCGHTICFSGNCSASLTKCHICRGNIEKKIKFYSS